MSGNNATRIPDWWAKLSPRNRTLIGLGTMLVALMAAALLAGVGKSGGGAPIGQKPMDVTNLMVPRAADMTQEALASRMDAAQKHSDALAGEVKRLTDEQIALRVAVTEAKATAAQAPAMLNSDLARQVERLAAQVESIKAGKGGEKGSPPSLADKLPASAPEDLGDAHQSTPDPAPLRDARSPRLRDVTMEVVGGKSVVTKASSMPMRDPGLAIATTQGVLLSGSFFEGILMNGMDAPTSSVTQKNPVPVTIRVKSDATLPNQYDAPVDECFVTAYGHGVLSTERANLRTEKISCVLENGRTIESALDGYVVGEDGKVGLRGRLVSKQGQMIARALMTGVFSGFAQSMTPTQVPQLNISPTGTQQMQMPQFDAAMQASAATGMSSAARAVTQFYLDMGKEMFPVVEVDAGRRVTIMVKTGLDISKGDGS